jgi:phosphinothricin acetyltransferase
MKYTIRNMQETDASNVMSIYNYYTKNGFAAYFDQPLPAQTFSRFQEMSQDYPAFVACDDDQEVIGFAFLHAYHSAPTFQRTAEITYFIHPEHISKLMLSELIAGAINIGVDNIIASISSQNIPSLSFHRKYGFCECGRLPSIGKKFGQDFDVVYMQLGIKAECQE